MNNSPRNFTHPLLWSFVLLAFVVIVAFFFRHWYIVGAEIGVTHPRPTDEGGVEVPDHAAFIAAMDASDIDLGRSVYEGSCIACHGSDGNQGTNGARKFSSEVFLNGADAYGMYLTLEKGYNLMPAQPLLSVEEKYAVIHYVRQEFLKEANPSQFIEINEDYLAAGAWPAPGLGDGPVNLPYGKNATAPLTVPVMAASQRYMEAVNLAPLQRWHAVVEQSQLSARTKVEWSASLSSFEASQLLDAVANEDETIFPQVAGDVLPGAALLPKSELLAARTALLASLNTKQTPASN